MFGKTQASDKLSKSTEALAVHVMNRFLEIIVRYRVNNQMLLFSVAIECSQFLLERISISRFIS